MTTFCFSPVPFSGGSSGRPIWYVSVSGDKIKMRYAFWLHTCSHIQVSVSSALDVNFVNTYGPGAVCEITTASWLLSVAPATMQLGSYLMYCFICFVKKEDKNWVNWRLHVRHFSVDGISASKKKIPSRKPSVRDPRVIRAMSVFSTSSWNLSKSTFCHIHVEEPFF